MKLIVCAVDDVKTGLPIFWAAGRRESNRGLRLIADLEVTTVGIFRTFFTQPEAMRYACVVARLASDHPDKTDAELKVRALEIIAHG